MRKKTIAYNEKFILVVDLFEINYFDGKAAINTFKACLIRHSLLFGHIEKRKRAHQFKIEVSISTASKVERFLNQM
jgi:hypothetical protein